MAALRPTYSRADTDIVSPTTDTSLESATNDSYKPFEKYDSRNDLLNEKSATVEGTALPTYDAEADNHFGEADVLTTAKDLVTHVLHVDDDPSLSPWTFRMFFLGE